MNSNKNLRIEPYTTELHAEPWLELMHLVQKTSDAWEAVYLNHPKFDFDYCFFYKEQLCGTLCGHLIDQSSEGYIYSIEVFAIHPDWHRQGLGKQILCSIWDHLPNLGGLIFWTTSLRAKSFYQSIQLHERQPQRLERKEWSKDKELIKQSWNTSTKEPHNLFEYIMTRQHASNLSNLLG